ncbi:hypothetical protein C0J45_5311, partial [Silurus meridionalis]
MCRTANGCFLRHLQCLPEQHCCSYCTCLKTTIIVPVPKESTVSCLNEHRPVALTPIVMKCFETLVMRNIRTQLPPSLDTMQYAYRSNFHRRCHLYYPLS